MTDIDIRPPDTFADVEATLGSNGGSVGCWCMFWRLTNQEATGTTADSNRRTLNALVDSGDRPGLVLYADGTPAGWVSVGPRDDFHRIARTKGLEYPTEADVWSIVCVYVPREQRGRGYSRRLIEAAVRTAGDGSARIVESYPLADPTQGRRSGMSSGTIEMYREAGFTIHREPPTGRRMVMRRATP